MSPREQAERFLDVVVGDGWLSTGTTPVLASATGVRVRPTDTELARWRENLFADWPADRPRMLASLLADAERREVYICPALRFARQRTKGGARPPRVCWSDVDRDEPLDPELLAKLVGMGAVVVRSGSGTRIHVYVLLSRAVSIVEHRALNVALCAALGGDEGKTTDESLLRLPGTLNHKHDPPTPVVLLEPGSGERIDPDELGALLGVVGSLAEAGAVVEENADAADSATVAAFVAEHDSGDRLELLRGGPLAAFDPTPDQRHPSMRRALPWALREARAGLYPAATARDELRAAYVAAKQDGGRLFDRLFRWSAGQAIAATAEQIAEVRERVRRPEARQKTSTAMTAHLSAVAGDGTEPDDELKRAEANDAAAERALAIELGSPRAARAVLSERARQAARDTLAAERAEPLRRLSASEFLASPSPTYLVPQMLPADGLTSMFGPEGTAKSFLALDVGLHAATGRAWRGHSLPRVVVHYVMAEGQGVNKLRTLAWLAHHGVDPAELEGQFHPYPQPILLTDAGVRTYLADVAADQPGLIILDTKNLMFEGKESNGEDGGAMARVLHRIRRAAGGACVLLIDHTGLNDTTRSRGGNAQRAAMDTEVRVVRGEGGVTTATVTRDKSGLDEASPPSWSFRLHPVPDVPDVPDDVMTPAVCVPLGDASPGAPLRTALPEWWRWSLDVPLPDDVTGPIEGVQLRGTDQGRGKDAARTLARYFLWASASGEDVTRSLTEAKTALGRSSGLPREAQHGPDSVRRAWDILTAAELIAPVTDAPSGTGAHRWNGPRP